MSPAEIKKLERELARLTKKSAALTEKRAAMPPGSSRPRVTTANARWIRAAEARDRVAAQLEAARAGGAL